LIIVYLLVALGSTTIGAMAGLGGGVIIKPVLDSLGGYDVATIGILSACTVFSMAIVSIAKQLKYKFKLNIRRIIFIGIGSIIGGALGESGLKYVLTIVEEHIVTIVQNMSLAILLILIFIYMNNKNKFKSFKVKNGILCILVGLLLGFMSSFLSIGGGPINICILTIFFSMSPKEAAVNSIITIIFSQGAQLFIIATTRGVEVFNLPILPVMIVGGILGGIIGSKLNNISEDKVILKVFNIVLVLLITLNIYNIISAVL